MTTEETPRNAHMYEVKEGHFKELGFWTLAEYAAYEKGRQDGEKVTIDFVSKWDGSTNSVFGAMLKLKMETLTDSENTRLRELVTARDEKIQNLNDEYETLLNETNRLRSDREHYEDEIKMLRVMDESQRKHNENLKSCMIAAAEEIMRVWPAHCDSDGYGPANLLHRLEKGISAEYGYKSGDFQRLNNDIEIMVHQLNSSRDEIEYQKQMYEQLNRDASREIDKYRS